MFEGQKQSYEVIFSENKHWFINNKTYFELNV